MKNARAITAPSAQEVLPPAKRRGGQAAAPAKQRGGKPEHQPTKAMRDQVEQYSGFGTPQESIAKFVGVEGKALRKHYRKELDSGGDKANALVAASLFDMATGRNGAERQVSAAIFWMKTRAGWKESPQQAVVNGEIRVTFMASDADL